MTRRTLALTWATMLLLAACGRGIDEAAAGVTTAPPTSSTTTTVAPQDTAPAGPAGELVVWVPARYRPATENAGDGFTTATGIGVTVEAVELADMEQAIRTGVGPDLFLGNHTWLSRLAPRGLAAPLGLEPRLGEFAPVAGDAFTVEGVVYGAPVTMTSVALFHRLEQFPTPPGAMSQVKEACEQLRGGAPAETTTTDGTTTTTEAVPAGPGCLEFLGTDARITAALVTAGPGYLYRPVEGTYLTDDVGLATDGARSRSAALRSLVDDGVVASAATVDEMVTRFAAGETPLLVGGVDLAEALSASGTPFGAAPLPIISGATPKPFVDVTGFMLAGRSTKAETALLFLNDYLLTAEAMADFFAAADALPAFGGTIDQVAADAVISGMLAAAAAGVPTPVVGGIEEAFAQLGPVLAGLLVAGGDAVDDILADAARLALAAA